MSEPGFNWVGPVLCVNDLVASLEHYDEVLGFETAWRWSEAHAFDEPGQPTFACVTRGEVSLFLCEKGQGNPGTWICLNVSTVEELETLYREYKGSGAIIAEKPQDCSWGMREMLVKDPDGNTFRMGTPIPEGG